MSRTPDTQLPPVDPDHDRKRRRAGGRVEVEREPARDGRVGEVAVIRRRLRRGNGRREWRRRAVGPTAEEVRDETDRDEYAPTAMHPPIVPGLAAIALAMAVVGI
jgi:hypothetical protein